MERTVSLFWIIQRLNERRQNEFEKTRNIFKRRSLKSKKKKILEDERQLKGYMVNWPIRREKSRRSNIKNIIYFLTCKFTEKWIECGKVYDKTQYSRMYKEPEKLIKSPIDMGKFQRSEGYRKGLLLYYSIFDSIDCSCKWFFGVGNISNWNVSKSLAIQIKAKLEILRKTFHFGIF